MQGTLQAARRAADEAAATLLFELYEQADKTVKEILPTKFRYSSVKYFFDQNQVYSFLQARIYFFQTEKKESLHSKGKAKLVSVSRRYSSNLLHTKETFTKSRNPTRKTYMNSVVT